MSQQQQKYHVSRTASGKSNQKLGQIRLMHPFQILSFLCTKAVQSSSNSVEGLNCTLPDGTVPDRGTQQTFLDEARKVNAESVSSANIHKSCLGNIVYLKFLYSHSFSTIHAKWCAQLIIICMLHQHSRISSPTSRYTATRK